ncbi:MAG TPA: alpha/beta fold hydrolase [Polyangiales bacterium]|nr:alpha/beta fold hydrolase [Polyangiales bacterium]
MSGNERRPPVLLVHGLWDSSARIEPMVQGLQLRGIRELWSFDLEPADGRAPIPELARQVQAQVDALLERHACERVDLVGFSMGALASRYYLQRCGGRERVRRFVSISGPHAGTWTAYALPFAGVRQMRPGSGLLRDLDADPDPWGEVEVHCIYTSLDLMIFPPESSILRGARATHRLRVPLHRWMIHDAGVLDLVARTLTCSPAAAPAT